jgi:glycosyltransferase involved in cell wall biosynthesis
VPKKKIFFLIRQLGLGGTERRMIDLAHSLIDIYEIRIVAITGYHHVHNVEKTSESESNRKNYFDKLIYLRKEILKHKPNIIHAFDPDSGIYASLALMTIGFKRPKLISGMGAEFIVSILTKELLKFSFFQPDLFICNSQVGGKFISSHYSNKIKLKVIPNGIDKERFMIKVDSPNWLTSGRPVIGYIGKLDKYKRGDRMLEIAKLLEGHPRKPLFVVIGNGEYINETKEQIELSPYLKENLLILGSVNNAAKYIQFFDIGILCSDSEGFPNVILEYMASGVPLVTTAVGDIPFIVDFGKAGILIDKYDSRKFASAISNLLIDSRLCKKMTSTAKARFEELFTIEIMKKQYLEIYRYYIGENLCVE